MRILVFFYNSWAVICIVNVAFGLLVNLMPINKWSKTENIKGLMKTLKNILTIIAVMLIVLSAGTYLFFTRVPKVTELNLSEARRYLRDSNLEDEYLPNLKYDSIAVNAEVNYQSIDEGVIVLKGTIIYLGFEQNVNKFSDIIDNSKNNYDNDYDNDSPENKTGIEGSNNNYNDDSPENHTDNLYNNVGSNHQGEGKAIVPDVVGMEQDDAIRALYMAGLQFQVFWNYNDDFNGDKYYVVNQNYKYGDSVDLGTIVKLELSPDLPESINYKTFTYEQDDSLVKSTEELNGFYIYSESVTYASFYNAVTNEVSSPDYLTEKLCQVCFNITGADNAMLSIFMEGKEIGIGIDNNAGKSEFFINKGSYLVYANFGNNTKTAYVNIDSSGEYVIDFN